MHVNHVLEDSTKIKEAKACVKIGRNVQLVKKQQIHHHPLSTEHVEIVHPLLFKNLVDLLVPHAHLGPHARVTRTKPIHQVKPLTVTAHL